MKNIESNITRRKLIKDIALAGMAGTLAPLGACSHYSLPYKEGLIVSENRKEGTTDWQLAYVRTRDFRFELIEGYCSRTSAKPGDSIDIFTSVYPTLKVVIDFLRTL